MRRGGHVTCRTQLSWIERRTHENDNQGRRGAPHAVRIALISEHASPLARLGSVDSGGQNVYVDKVARMLARRGHRVDVVTRRDDPALPPVVELEPGARVIHVDAGPPRFVAKEAMLEHMPEFSAALMRLVAGSKRYDLVHANFFMSGLVALALKARFGMPRRPRSEDLRAAGLSWPLSAAEGVLRWNPAWSAAPAGTVHETVEVRSDLPEAFLRLDGLRLVPDATMPPVRDGQVLQLRAEDSASRVERMVLRTRTTENGPVLEVEAIDGVGNSGKVERKMEAVGH